VKRRELGLIAFSGFLLMLGLSVLFPVLPHFSDKLGLDEFQAGLLMSSYALASVVMAPFWGRFSERRGRKSALLIGLAGFTATFFLFALGETFGWLLTTRALGGLFAAAAMPSVMAYTADISPPDKRSVTLGVVGAAIGIGTVIGAGVGGILGDPDFFGEASLRLPFFVASAIGFLATLLVAGLLPESLTGEIIAAAQTRKSALERAGLGMRAISSGLLTFLSYSFLVQMGQTGLQALMGWLILHRFEGSASSTSGFLFVMGMTGILIQGGAMRGLSRRFSDRSLLIVGTLCLVVGTFGVGVTGSWTGMLWLAALLGLGTGLQLPTFTAELSRAAEQVQGEAQGLNASAQSLGRAVGPLVFTALYQISGPVAAFSIAAAVCAAGAGLAIGGLKSQLPVATVEQASA